MENTTNASMGEPQGEAEREYRERIEFTSRLGFGDDKTEPAARLADIVDAIEYAFSQSSDHIECPTWCELCGERLADKDCEPCCGSGCGPRTAEGADDECEHCAGVGRVHEGCVGKTYTELAAENAQLKGQLAEVKAELDHFRRAEFRRMAAALDKAKANPIAPSQSESQGTDAKALGLDGGGSGST